MCVMLSDCGMLTSRTGEEILFQFIIIQCRLQLNTDLCCYLSKLSVALGKKCANQYIPYPAALAIGYFSFRVRRSRVHKSQPLQLQNCHT